MTPDPDPPGPSQAASVESGIPSPADEPQRAVSSERDRMPKWVPKAVGLVLGGVVVLTAAAWMIERLQSLLVVLLVSLFVSFAMEPAVNWLAAKGMARGLATGIVFFGTAVALVGFLAAMASVIASQIETLVDTVPDYLDRLEEWTADTFGTAVSTDAIASYFAEGGSAGSMLTNVAGNLVAVGSTVVNVAVQLLTITLFTFYLVAEGPKLRRLICSALVPRHQQAVLRGWEIAIDKTGGYIYSRTVLAFIAFLFHWLVFAIIGMPFPVPLALWVGLVSQFVPVVGTYLAGLLPLLIALLDRPVSALWVVTAVVAYQQIENYLVSPRITARTMNIHPAVAFGAVLAGAALLGSVGAFLAVPAAATLQAFVSTYVKRHELIASDLFADESDPDADERSDAKSDGATAIRSSERDGGAGA